MRFAIDSEKLNEAISIVTKALSNRSTLPVLEGILVRSAPDGLRLTCSDGALTITTRVDAEFEEDGDVVLPGKLFTDLSRKLPHGEATISVSDKLVVKVNCAGSRATLMGMEAAQFPALPEFDVNATVALPGELLGSMIRDTVFAAANDDPRRTLNGCLLEIAGGEARMVALDGFRMSVRRENVPPDTPSLRAILPSRLLDELSKLIGGDELCYLTFGESQLRAKAGDVEAFATLLDGNYVEYRNIIPRDWTTRVIVCDREQFAMSVERASLMARESKLNHIKLDIESGTMVITSNSEVGDIHEEIQIELEGAPLTIAFNVRYITDVLRVMNGEQLEMSMTTGVSPCLIKRPGDDGFLYVALPVRLRA